MLGLRVQGGAKSRAHQFGKAKASKGVKRTSKPRRAVDDHPAALLQSAQFEQPAASLALAARLGYSMESTQCCNDVYTPGFVAATASSPLKTSFQLAHANYEASLEHSLFSQSVGGRSQRSTRPLEVRDVNAASQTRTVCSSAGCDSEAGPDFCKVQVALEDGQISNSSTNRYLGSMAECAPCEGLIVDTGLNNSCSGGFTFSASQPVAPVAQPGKSLAHLPDYGAKRRKQSRESLPHCSLMFVGFSPWLEVSFFTLKV